MRIKGTQVPDDFYPDELRVKWLENKHPNVDIAEATERFLAWATSHEYVNHSRAWQNFIIRASDENKLTPMLKKIKPKSIWDDLLTEATAIGFRQPNHGEKIDDYRTALTSRRTTNKNKVTSLLR